MLFVFKEIGLHNTKNQRPNKGEGIMILKRNHAFWVSVLSLVFLLSGCGHSSNKENTPAQQSDKVVGVKEHNQGRMADTLSIARDSLLANIKRQQAIEEQKAQKELVKEALTAIQETQHAIAALDQGKKDEALKAMAMVLGKLEILLERNPDLALVPIDASSQVINLISDLDKIEAMHKQVKELVDKGYLQAARRLLDNMVSEIRVTTSNIPLQTYPVAIKLAARLTDQGKLDEAKAVLVNALSTIVVREVSIPIPVINAQAMVDLAADSVEAHPQKAMELLKEAEYQLKVAEALGYGNRDKEFKAIIKDMETIKDKIERQEETGGLFDALRNRLQKFKERISK
jgi:tetratricopeptide (TPR) repeat protein